VDERTGETRPRIASQVSAWLGEAASDAFDAAIESDGDKRIEWARA